MCQELNAFLATPSLSREAVEARNDELAQALGSGDPERVAQACEEIAEAYQQVSVRPWLLA